ncbi:MAG: helicase Cas3 [Syntrophorhabdus sp. PtaU1.Bin153]|nr:MAG: helicase Cas3 [Syntrophorhabdus sp. PtaU1.Bin153]
MSENFIAHRRDRDGEVQDLQTHLDEVASLAGEFAATLGLRQAGELIGLVHDLGKASQEFHQYIRSAVGLIHPDDEEYLDAAALKGKIDHSTAGAQAIFRHFSTMGPEGLLAGQILALVVASHHSGLIDVLALDGHDNFQRRMEKPEEQAHTNEALSNLKEYSGRVSELCSDSLMTRVLTTLKSVKESNESVETFWFKAGLLVRFLFSCLIDADKTNTAEFERPENRMIRGDASDVPWHILISRLEEHLHVLGSENEVDRIRQRVSQQCLEFASKEKGLFQLTVPTGGGKTFASLRFALNHLVYHNMRRIFYIIPFTSIIDQNAEEVRRVLEVKGDHGKYQNEVVLEHHSNLTPQRESRRQALLAVNWDAPVVFTTQVQFLEAFFSAGTRGARRLHRLANAVIIFDEVQTIPVRCVHIFNLAVRFLVHNCGSTVVLCSATQPLLDEVEPIERSLLILPEQRMVPDAKGLFQALKRVSVHDRRKAGGWSDGEIAELAEQEVKLSNSALIVVNTKRSAQTLFSRLKASSIAEVYHLSTNMCPAHRMIVLRKIKERLDDAKPTICVSTQLIEAGVNIDFGAVIRYLAGLDSIAQAAGRCNRHGLRPTGNVHIVNPENEDLSRLEDIRIAKENAQRVLDEYRANPELFDADMVGPSIMNRYYFYYFYARRSKMNYPLTQKRIGVDDNLFNLLSTNSQAVQAYQRIYDRKRPPSLLQQSFETAATAFEAIDSPSRGVVVPYGKKGKAVINELCSAFDLNKECRLLKRAQRFSVNVFIREFEQLSVLGAIHEVQEGTGVFYLDSQYYSDEIGLCKGIVNEMEAFTV